MHGATDTWFVRQVARAVEASLRSHPSSPALAAFAGAALCHLPLPTDAHDAADGAGGDDGAEEAGDGSLAVACVAATAAACASLQAHGRDDGDAAEQLAAALCNLAACTDGATSPARRACARTALRLGAMASAAAAMRAFPASNAIAAHYGRLVSELARGALLGGSGGDGGAFEAAAAAAAAPAAVAAALRLRTHPGEGLSRDGGDGACGETAGGDAAGAAAAMTCLLSAAAALGATPAASWDLARHGAAGCVCSLLRALALSQQQPSDEPAARFALEALGCLVASRHPNALAAAAADSYEVAASVGVLLSRHGGSSAPLAARGCWAAATLAAASFDGASLSGGAACEALVARGTARSVAAAMRSHPLDAAVLQHGCWAVAALAPALAASSRQRGGGAASSQPRDGTGCLSAADALRVAADAVAAAPASRGVQAQGCAAAAALYRAAASFTASSAAASTAAQAAAAPGDAAFGAMAAAAAPSLVEALRRGVASLPPPPASPPPPPPPSTPRGASSALPAPPPPWLDVVAAACAAVGAASRSAPRAAAALDAAGAAPALCRAVRETAALLTRSPPDGAAPLLCMLCHAAAAAHALCETCPAAPAAFAADRGGDALVGALAAVTRLASFHGAGAHAEPTRNGGTATPRLSLPDPAPVDVAAALLRAMGAMGRDPHADVAAAVTDSARAAVDAAVAAFASPSPSPGSGGGGGAGGGGSDEVRSAAADAAALWAPPSPPRHAAATPPDLPHTRTEAGAGGDAMGGEGAARAALKTRAPQTEERVFEPEQRMWCFGCC